MSIETEPPTTTDDEPNTEQRVLDLDAPRAVSIDGATLIECDAYARTGDEQTLRYDGSEPLFVVGIYSARDARHALTEAGYGYESIERAFKLGEWAEANKQDHMTEAIAIAERDEVRAMTDGGQPRAECESCMDALAAHEREVGYCESCAVECFVGSGQ